MRDVGKLLTVDQAAERLGLRASTVRRMILERRIDTVRPGARAVRIPQESIDRMITKGFTKAIYTAEQIHSDLSDQENLK
jgi:excisionase family DNA binding protein